MSVCIGGIEPGGVAGQVDLVGAAGSACSRRCQGRSLWPSIRGVVRSSWRDPRRRRVRRLGEGGRSGGRERQGEDGGLQHSGSPAGPRDLTPWTAESASPHPPAGLPGRESAGPGRRPPRRRADGEAGRAGAGHPRGQGLGRGAAGRPAPRRRRAPAAMAAASRSLRVAATRAATSLGRLERGGQGRPVGARRRPARRRRRGRPRRSRRPGRDRPARPGPAPWPGPANSRSPLPSAITGRAGDAGRDVGAQARGEPAQVVLGDLGRGAGAATAGGSAAAASAEPPPRPGAHRGSPCAAAAPRARRRRAERGRPSAPGCRRRPARRRRRGPRPPGSDASPGSASSTSPTSAKAIRLEIG